MIIYLAGEHSLLDIDPELVKRQEGWKVDHECKGRLLSFYYLQKMEAQRAIFNFYKGIYNG